MASKFQRSLLGILVLAFAFPAVAGAHGGQDGGGGSTYKSSSKQVFAAIEKAMEMASDPQLDQRSFQVQGIDSKTLALVATVIHPKIRGGAKTTADKWFGAGDTLSMSRILIRDEDPGGYRLEPPFVADGSGPCPSGHGDQDASVSRNELGADICFSIGRLRVHSPQAIVKEVFALLMHELTHIAGYGEDEADEIQQFYLDNYDEIFNLARKTARQDILFQQQLLVNEIEVINGTRLETLRTSAPGYKLELYEGLGIGEQQALGLQRRMGENNEHTWAFDDEAGVRQTKAFENIATQFKILKKLIMYSQITPEQLLKRLEPLYEEAQRNCFEIQKSIREVPVDLYLKGCNGEMLTLQTNPQ